MSWFFEPWNIMCSNRWAKPVRPGFSSFEPTLYKTFTDTTGVLWSSWRMTVRPLGSVYFSTLSSGIWGFRDSTRRGLGGG